MKNNKDIFFDMEEILYRFEYIAGTIGILKYLFVETDTSELPQEKLEFTLCEVEQSLTDNISSLRKIIKEGVKS